jgi:hypothetical protein
MAVGPRFGFSGFWPPRGCQPWTLFPMKGASGEAGSHRTRYAPRETTEHPLDLTDGLKSVTDGRLTLPNGLHQATDAMPEPCVSLKSLGRRFDPDTRKPDCSALGG